jgi:hypothetical protein
MLRAWGTPLGRPTRDIDFLGEIDNSAAAVEEAVRDCLAVQYADDGLAFDEDIETAEINVADKYPGVRVVVRGQLDGGRFRLQLDVGVDDAIVPDPEWVDYPTLLDLDAPRILAYQPATAVAEKFETMVSKGLANSRLRDYYDVWLLSTVHAHDGAELTALAATFSHRGTTLPSAIPPALTASFTRDAEARARWSAFLSGKGIEAPADLAEVCELIISFIMPPSAAAAAGESFKLTWKPAVGWS